MAKEEKLRSDISDKYKWDLTCLYKNDDEWEADYKKLQSYVNNISDYKGIIAKDEQTLYDFLQLDDNIDTLMTNLYVYASSKNDEDVENQKNKKRYNKILNYFSTASEKTSFAVPELLSTNYDVIKKYVNNYDKLKKYDFNLKMIYRNQPYTLSETEEKLLSNITDLQSKYENNFSIITNSIFDYGYIKDEDDNDVKLTNGNYSKYIRSQDRMVRKSAYEARNKVLKKYVGLIATDYEGNIKADSVVAKARGFKSDLEMYLYPDGVSVDTYNSLLEAADKNINVLYKYYDMIKSVLKLDELYPYDLAAPLTKNSTKTYTPEDAKEIIIKALRVYDDDYVNVIASAFDNRWIDFYPNKGKKSGYYQTDAFVGNPIVLANYTDDYVGVSSLAHELGHAMHSYYSKKNNDTNESEYSILVAEVASLTNEILLSNYIINNSDDKNEKLSAINNILDVFSNNFYGTLAEGSIFEKIVHDKVYNGESLTEVDFNSIYDNIKDRYYGPLVKGTEDSKYNWARVPHFYTSFYYYKYSIGICGACYVAKKILSGDKEFLEKYKKFLSLGGSMMPLDELKTIGFDLNDNKIIEEGINYFNELIDQFINIYNS